MSNFGNVQNLTFAFFFAVALNLCRFNGWRTSTSSVTNHKPGDKKGQSLATWVALRYSAGV